MQITIKRGSTFQAINEIDDKTIYSAEFMGEDKITTSFVRDSKIDVQVGDYIEYQGKKYSIVPQVPPSETKGGGLYTYDITFYGPMYDWNRKIVRHANAITFPYTDTPLGFMMLIIDNIRLFDIGWTLGTVELIDEPQTLQFDGTSCRVALTMVAEAFDLEFFVKDKKVNLVKSAGKTVNGVTFSYGLNRGLYSIRREGSSNNFANVWYGQGGNKNLPENYRSGQTRLGFDGNPLIVQESVNRFGVIEGNVTFEDIYPKRTSTIQSSTKISDALFEVSDETIDFDINTLQINDSAKIVFKSGPLGGNEFQISSYNAATKTIRYKVNQEDSGYVLPNDTLKPAAGDKYTLVGIVMPASYVTVAETELQNKTSAHAQENSFPKFVYALDIDEHFVREIGYEYTLNEGDRVPVKDVDMQLDAALRVQIISWPLVSPANISAKLSEKVEYTQGEKLLKAIVTAKATAKDSTDKSKKALAGALFAKQVADDIANAAAISLFKHTSINNLSVLSGAFVAGNPETGAVGGIDGTSLNPTDIVIWAGASYEERTEAPFRVQYNGETYMSEAFVRGVINATGGKIGNWTIDNNGLTQIGPDDAYIIQRKDFGDGKYAEARIGTNILPASSAIRAVGYFLNEEVRPVLDTNYGIVIKVSGAGKNVAADLIGDVNINGTVDIKGYPGTNTGIVKIGGLPSTNSMQGKSPLVWDFTTGQIWAYSG